MLVIAPHQDDETIGCGGALALQVAAGADVRIVLLHDGADEHESRGMTREEMTTLRNAESTEAARLIGLPSPLFLDCRSLKESREYLTARLLAIVREQNVDAIFSPYLLDFHADHVTTNQILVDVLKDVSWQVRIFGYEVWGLVIPNVIVSIDHVIDKKIAMLDCFRFANSALNYTQSTKGLNMYRSRLLPAGECAYAECFFELPKSEYLKVANELFRRLDP